MNSRISVRRWRPSWMRLSITTVVTVVLVALGAASADATVYTERGGVGSLRVNCNADAERVQGFASMGIERDVASQVLAVRFWLYDYRYGRYVRTSPWISGGAAAFEGPLSGYWEASYSFSTYDRSLSRYAVYVEYAWRRGQVTWIYRGEFPTTYYQWAGGGPAWVPSPTCYA